MNNVFMFDLDGTLLGMDQEKFLVIYFSSIKDKLINLKHDPQVFFYYLDKGIKAMLNNDGSKTNEEAFNLATRDYKGMLDILNDYYLNDFIKTKESCYVNPYSQKVIDLLKTKKKTIILATNPIFPLMVTKERIKWAGLNPEDFKYITSYENSTYTKPKKAYFMEILTKLKLKPEDINYIGNDVSDDFKEIRNDTFNSYLITDCLINKDNEDYNIKQFSMEEFYNYLKDNL